MSYQILQNQYVQVIQVKYCSQKNIIFVLRRTVYIFFLKIVLVNVLTLNNILSLFYTMPLVRSKYVSSVVKIYICFVVNIRNDQTIFHYVQVSCHNILTKTEDSMSFIVNILILQHSNDKSNFNIINGGGNVVTFINEGKLVRDSSVV